MKKYIVFISPEGGHQVLRADGRGIYKQYAVFTNQQDAIDASVVLNNDEPRGGDI